MPERALTWSDLALQQLREARDFIAEDDPDAADRVVESVRETAALLQEFPAIGRAFGEFRSFVVPGTPFRLIYVASGSGIFVTAIWHGARRWPFGTD